MSAAPLEPKSTFAERYLVRRKLGRGAMGAVYLVEDRVLQEQVALKVLSSALVGAGAIERFRREVRLARRVTHRNVVRTHDVGVAESGQHYLTMEWIDGEGLDRLLARGGPLPVERVLQLALPLLDGLAAAHEAGVIHRDLKPSNVLIEAGERVVITDFGIAHSTISDVSEALTDGVIGTPHYMAPEQLEGKAVDARTDIYALGGVLFELITGTLPFEGPTPLALALARLQQPPRPIASLARIDHALAAVVMRCLARAPEARPRSVAQLRDALTAAAGGDAATVPPSVAATAVGSSLGPLVAPMPRGRSLAVLPLRYQGAADDAYLADGLTEDLIDLLARTRGLRVFGGAATSRFRERRDPQQIAAELGADLVVDATLRRVGPRVRISARLLEAHTGLQLWSQPFEGLFEDLFALQETMSRRVAEALRLEISLRPALGPPPAEAVALYLRARRQTRHYQLTADAERTFEALERCLQLAPTMGPAQALQARLCISAWFFSAGEGQHAVWARRARDSVERALAGAGDVAETQLAAAMLASQQGDYRSAVSHLVQGLAIAPTCAALLVYLGGLQCEAGRPKEGIERLEAGIELDPHQLLALTWLARTHALRGDERRYQAAIERVRDSPFGESLAYKGTVARVSLWRGDRDAASEALSGVARRSDPAGLLFNALRAAVDGKITAQQLHDGTLQVSQGVSNRRTLTLAMQVLAEVLSALGRPDLAFEAVSRAAEGALIDVLWLERCPLLDPLRQMPGFGDVMWSTRERAAALWVDHVS